MRPHLPERRATSARPFDFSPKAREAEAIFARLAQKPAALLSLLVELHRLVGPLLPGAIEHVAQRLALDPVDVSALAEAHQLLSGRRQPSRLGICAGGSCAARGGNEVERLFTEKMLRFEPLHCQGACDLGPIACFDRGAPLAISVARARSLVRAELSDWEELLAVEKPVHAFRTEPRVAFANLFAKGSHLFSTARRLGVFQSLSAESGPSAAAILDALDDSGLIGGERDGRPAAEKLRALASRQGPRVLVVDALDPGSGSTRHRVLLERDPLLVLAGSALAARAAGIDDVFLCLRADYELVRERCQTAIDELTRSGLLGKRGADGPTFQVRACSGIAFCAHPPRLVEALDGRAPVAAELLDDPEVRGLGGRPTLVLDAETLACLPAIVQNGGAWYRALGGAGQARTVSSNPSDRPRARPEIAAARGGESCCEGAAALPAGKEVRGDQAIPAGTKLVSLGGDVKRPGNYELLLGETLRALVEVLGGGLAQGKKLVALQVGGASGPYLPAEALDARFTPEALSRFGAHIGNGAVSVISEKSCLFDLARRELQLFARESCLACGGCPQAFEALIQCVERLGSGGNERAHFDALERQFAARNCAFAQEATRPFRSVLLNFGDHLDAHASRGCTCFPKRKTRG